MSGSRRSLRPAGTRLLLLALASCAPASSQAPPALSSAPATTRAWVGEDAARGLKVVVEPILEPAAPGTAAIEAAAPLRQAVALTPGEVMLVVHVFGPDAGDLAALLWPDGSRMLPAQLREDAGPRERLLYEAVGAGGAHAWSPASPALRRDYLVAGRPDKSMDAELTWSGISGSLQLAPRSWTPAERLAGLGEVRPAHPDVPHD